MSTRKIILGSLVATLVASSAFANTGRIAVMGTADPFGLVSGTDGEHGSLFVDDNYNIFYNPSYANDFKNWVSVERSNGLITTGGTAPTTAFGGAEGGFVASAMNLSFGAFMNRGTGVTPYFSNAARQGLTPIDLIIAGDTGFKWGLGFSFGADKNAPAGVSGAGFAGVARYFDINIGAQVAGLDPFIHLSLANSNPDPTSHVETRPRDMDFGLKYHFGEWTPFAMFYTSKADTSLAVSNTNYGVGLGRSTKIAEGANLAYALSYWRAPSAGADGSGWSILPIDISAEADLASWITARAGVVYNLVNRIGGSTNQANTTTGRMGVTLHFQKVAFDFVVAGNNNLTEAAAVSGNIDSRNFDLGSGTFSRASLTYTW